MNKKIIRYIVYAVFVVMLLIQLVMFLKTSNCFCLSSDIDDWKNYGSAISSWSLPFLTLINALVLFLVDNQLSRNLEIANLRDNRFKIMFSKFEAFRTSFLDAHRQLQESIGFNNQQACFDNWKAVFSEFYEKMVELSPSIKDCEYMDWWRKEFDKHTTTINFAPEGKYDPAEYSRNWSLHIGKLYSELCEYILSGK